ncbi:hypothetical protein [Endozoicomonas sp. GU-1]|uniref:hypothetical protein n=1 Tax=Endozoicomonas sp. GU-1 TaxID=3009078 RepID=UPI0022B3C3DF|nr:hypothetical protein [Endozoicomonas sp. GU-1]WBA82777.1 hypothetical protein O2T12_06515 [Endozoicomonas sp. GU-1]
MAEAVSMQLAVPTQPAASMPPDLPNSGQTANVSCTELTKEKNLYVTDAMGNSRQVRLVERWELRTVQNRLFAKPLGSELREVIGRNITSQCPQTPSSLTALPLMPVAVSPPAFISNAASGNRIWTALPDRSIASLFTTPPALHVVVCGPDLTESPSAQSIIEVIAKVAQLIALLTGGSAQIIDAGQGEPEDHAASQGGRVPLSQQHSISELLGNLINSLMLQGRPEDIQKAMELSRLAEKLSQALKDANSLTDSALLQEVDSLFNQYSTNAEIAPEKGLALVNRQYHPDVFKPGVVNGLGTGVEHDGLSAPAKSGVNNGHGENRLKNGEGPVSPGNKSANEAVRPESGNKVAINTSANTSVNNSATAISSAQAMGSLNQLLASMGLANIAAQPPLAVESGPKQLPPIILPNTNPGNRLDKRRKSRKELKEEEEKRGKVRGRLFYLMRSLLSPLMMNKGNCLSIQAKSTPILPLLNKARK